MLDRLRTYLELIRFSHTLFALPFALIGALCAARGLPPPTVLAWAVVAVVGARTAAMAWNRLVDRTFDARNPRTAARAIPAGRARPVEAALVAALGAATFLLACAGLNRGSLLLAAPVLTITLGYSYTKRFTSLSHLVLGAALGLAPLGGWIAVQGEIADYPVALSLGVLGWVAGFDIVYACQDEEFDRREGLRSIPACFGRRRSLALALGLHAAAVGCFAVAGAEARLGTVWYGGLAVATLALVAEHRLARREDPVGIGSAWLTLNAAVGVVLLVATVLALTVATPAAAAGVAEADTERRGDEAWRARGVGFLAHGRVDSETAERAVRAYEEALAARPTEEPLRFKLVEALWFRAHFTETDRTIRRQLFDRVVELSEETANHAPEAPEPHFWAAIGWGEWAGVHSHLAAVVHDAPGKIRRHAEALERIDRTYRDGAALRILGRLHAVAPRVPAVTGWVDREHGIELLRQANAISTDDARNPLFLAEALLRWIPDGRVEAESLLSEVAAREPTPRAIVEESETINAARTRLAELGR